ncbi:MAG: hypothetical protein RL757_132 [Bacteroidota bacterium]|jgi:2-oxoglutarate dehydrogenase E2 component (dihydrolipoamide succinyltransferase)
MARYELLMPKLGESVTDATVLKWVKNIGDRIEMDETVLEIATDKVDSIVPSEVSGVLVEILHPENAVVAVGLPLAIIETSAVADVAAAPVAPVAESVGVSVAPLLVESMVASSSSRPSESGRFYSPLVRTMAQKENISTTELAAIVGTGQQGRVTKHDILNFLANRHLAPTPQIAPPPVSEPKMAAKAEVSMPTPSTSGSFSGNVEIIEMDRMRKLIADHMVMSKHTSPHVTSFVEVDVTNLVLWRNRIKGEFKAKYGENITFTPVFLEAVAKAIGDYPLINSSVDGTKIIVKKDINIGMAAALPTGNLIVPVVRNANFLNLAGMTKQVNDLAARARAGQLKPDEIQGGTFTVTNVGTFGNVMGTPIINQPQVAIMATGAIKKKPAVIETEFGDVIAIRHMMFLSLSYDHRVVDGALGGSFLRRVGDYLEQFDGKRSI